VFLEVEGWVRGEREVKIMKESSESFGE